MVSSGEAATLLEEIGRVRRSTRSRIGEHTWMAFVVWAVVFAGAALVGGAAPWYWAAAVPVALAVTALIECRLSWARTVRRGEGRYWLIGGAISVLCFGGGAFLPVAVVAAWVWVVLGLGFAGFALLEHHSEAALVMAGLSGVALLAGVTVSDPEVVYRGLGVLFAVGVGWIAWRIKP